MGLGRVIGLAVAWGTLAACEQGSDTEVGALDLGLAADAILEPVDGGLFEDAGESPPADADGSPPDGTPPGPDVDAEAVPPDAAPAEAVPEDCLGRYLVTAWTFDVAPFNPHYLNQLVTRDLDDGSLVVALRFDPGAAMLWIDAVVGPAGDLVQDPTVPDSPPLALEADGDRGFASAAPGEVYVHLNAADYQGAQPINLHLLRFEIEGRFDAGCGELSGRIAGAFRNQPGFTIPVSPDTDTDGDGVADAFMLGSTFRATRQ